MTLDTFFDTMAWVILGFNGLIIYQDTYRHNRHLYSRGVNVFGGLFFLGLFAWAIWQVAG